MFKNEGGGGAKGPPLDIGGGGLGIFFLFHKGDEKLYFFHLRIGCISTMPCGLIVSNVGRCMLAGICDMHGSTLLNQPHPRGDNECPVGYIMAGGSIVIESTSERGGGGGGGRHVQ